MKHGMKLLSWSSAAPLLCHSPVHMLTAGWACLEMCTERTYVVLFFSCLLTLHPSIANKIVFSMEIQYHMSSAFEQIYIISWHVVTSLKLQSTGVTSVPRAGGSAPDGYPFTHTQKSVSSDCSRSVGCAKGFQ